MAGSIEDQEQVKGQNDEQHKSHGAHRNDPKGTANLPIYENPESQSDYHCRGPDHDPKDRSYDFN